MELRQNNLPTHYLVLAVGALLAILTASIVPHFMLGHNTYFLIHDHLDSRAAWAAILGDGGYLFAHPMTIVEPFMGGQARWQFGKPFDIYYLLFALLPTYEALVVNETLQTITAFVAMALLTRRYLVAGHPQEALIAISTAAAFAALPFWPGAGIDIAVTPLLVSAYLDSRARIRLPEAFAVAIIAGVFVSPFFLGVFAAVGWGLFWLRDLVADRHAALGPAFWFIAIFCLFQVGSEYQMLWAYLSGSMEASHRSEIRISTVSFNQTLAALWTNFSRGQYHANPVQQPLLLPIALLSLSYATLTAFKNRAFRPVAAKLATVLAVILATALVFAAFTSEMFQAAWSNSGLPLFNISRFHWLQPMLWASAFALSLGVLTRIVACWPPLPIVLVATFGLAQTANALRMSDRFTEARSDEITFGGFISSSLFMQLSAKIGSPSETNRVGSIGLHPAIAQLNGLWTVDGYTNLYPLRYKRAFRKVIVEELAGDDRIRDYYDSWGNRVYIFASELWHPCQALCTRARAPEVVTLGFDASAFHALGGRYIISTSVITNATAIGLGPRGTFTDPASPWRIHLYAVEPDTSER